MYVRRVCVGFMRRGVSPLVGLFCLLRGGVGLEYDLVSLGCTASCGWHMRCIVVRGDAWPVLLSPCNTWWQWRGDRALDLTDLNSNSGPAAQSGMQPHAHVLTGLHSRALRIGYSHA